MSHAEHPHAPSYAGSHVVSQPEGFWYQGPDGWAFYYHPVAAETYQRELVPVLINPLQTAEEYAYPQELEIPADNRDGK